MKYLITASRLKQALNDKGMTARELSTRSGVSEASISQYINGTHKPGNVSSGKMAEVLDCDPVWLMGFRSPSPSSEREEKEDSYYTVRPRKIIDASIKEKKKSQVYVFDVETNGLHDSNESTIYHMGHYVTDRMIDDHLYCKLVKTSMELHPKDLETAISMLEYLIYKREKG